MCGHRQYKGPEAARCLTAGLRIGGGLVWLRWRVQGEWEDRKAERDGDRTHGRGGLWRGAELRRSYLLLADEDTEPGWSHPGSRRECQGKTGGSGSNTLLRSCPLTSELPAGVPLPQRLPLPIALTGHV